MAEIAGKKGRLLWTSIAGKKDSFFAASVAGKKDGFFAASIAGCEDAIIASSITGRERITGLEKQETKVSSALALFAAAFFWGTTFVAQSLGAGNVGTFTFLTLRSFLGTALVLLVIGIRTVLLRGKARSVKESGEDKTAGKAVDQGKVQTNVGRDVLVAGACCGLCLFLASALQQYGIGLYVIDADPGGTAKSSFITAMYVVIVPVLSIFRGKRPEARIWGAVALCVAGLYLLCLSGGLRFSRGDIFEILCALGFSVQIMTVDRFSRRVDGLKLSAAEFFTTGVASLIGMLLFEHPEIGAVQKAMPAILYAAVFSNSIAYTCQIYGQKGVRPALASMIMCLESVVGVLSGVIVLHETLGGRQILGCVLMFAALLLAELKIPSRPSASGKDGGEKERECGEESPQI